MDLELESEWRKLLKDLNSRFEGDLDLKSVLFLIGLQELGKGYQKLSKDEKLNVMHIATCRILEPYGYYRYTGKDSDGWPHYEDVKGIPALTEDEQKRLLKGAIIQYFKEALD